MKFQLYQIHSTVYTEIFKADPSRATVKQLQQNFFFLCPLCHW